MNKLILLTIVIILIPTINAETLHIKVNVDTANNTASISTSNKDIYVYDCDKQRKQTAILEVNVNTNNDLLSQQLNDCNSKIYSLEKDNSELKEKNDNNRVELIKEQINNKDCVSSKAISESRDKIIDDITKSNNIEKDNIRKETNLRDNVIIVLSIILIAGVLFLASKHKINKI